MSLADRHPRLSRTQAATALHHAIAFQILRTCEPVGWELTASQVAERIGYPVQAVLNVARKRGWATRFRAGSTDRNHPGRFGPVTPRPLDDYFAGPDDLSLVEEMAQ